MGFENFEIKPKKAETKPNKPDLYDLAKKDLEEDMAKEKNKESGNIPEETMKEELSEEKKIIGEEITEQLQKEGEILGGDLGKIKDKANRKIAAAILVSVLFTTGMASVAEARGGRDQFLGREVERAVGRVIGDVAKGVGEALGNIFRRGGTGETPREQERKIERERRKILEQDRDYDRIKERITEKYTRSLQEERDEEGRVITETRRNELLKNYIYAKKAVDLTHKEKGHPEGLCSYKDEPDSELKPDSESEKN